MKIGKNGHLAEYEAYILSQSEVRMMLFAVTFPF